MKLTDDQLLEALKDVGHEKAAASLEEEMGAEAPAGKPDQEPGAAPAAEPFGLLRLAGVQRKEGPPR